MRDERKISRITERQLGLITRAQLTRIGLSPKNIDYLVRSGGMEVVHRGVYLAHGRDRTFEVTVLAAVMAAGSRSYGSHRAAGVLLRLEGVEEPDEIDISVMDRRRVRLPGVMVHRPTSLSRRDVTTIGPIPVTSPHRTLLDLCAILPVRRAEIALDHAIRRDLIDPVRSIRRVPTDVPGAAVYRELLRDRIETGHTESPLERAFLSMLRRARLPEPVKQFEVRDGLRRFVARVDFAYPERRIAMEVDGYAFHSGRQRWEAGYERKARLEELGWRVLEFNATAIRRTPDRSVARIRTVYGSIHPTPVGSSDP